MNTAPNNSPFRIQNSKLLPLLALWLLLCMAAGVARADETMPNFAGQTLTIFGTDYTWDSGGTRELELVELGVSQN